MNLIKKLLKKKTVCLNAGHSFTDPGAVYGSLKESNLNMDIVEKAANILRIHGVDTLTVPDDLSLVKSIQWINERANQIDIAVACHVNSNKGVGVEAWHYKQSAKSKELSQFLVDAVVAETGMKDRGVKDESTNRYGKLGFVHDTYPLAALIENGFIDNKADREILSSEQGRMRIAKGVARGILGYFQLDWKPDLLIKKMPQGKQIEEQNRVIRGLEKSAIATEKAHKKELANKDYECQQKIKKMKQKITKFVRGVE